MMHLIKSIDFSFIAIMCLIGCTTQSTHDVNHEEDARPNIVFIFADDWG